MTDATMFPMQGEVALPDDSLPDEAQAQGFIRKPEEFDAYVAGLVKETSTDVSTKAARTRIASAAYKIARIKSTIDNAGKAMNEGLRKQINAVDERRRVIKERLETLQNTIRKPLDDWQAAEDLRVQNMRMTREKIEGLAMVGADEGSNAIGARIGDLEAVELLPTVFVDEFDMEEALDAKKAALKRLEVAREAAVKREADARELAELRKANEERQKQEETDRQAKMAEEEAQRRARMLAEADRIEAEKKAREAEEAAARRQREHEAEMQRAKDEADARVKAAQDAAQRVADEARRAEEARQAEAKRRQEEDDRRAADREHRAALMGAAQAKLAELAGISGARAEKIVLAIVAGEIPNVKMVF